MRPKIKSKKMFKVDVYIEIGDDKRTWKFDYCAEFDNFGSIENLTETLNITLPRKLKFEGKNINVGKDGVFKVGDKVLLQCGYDGNLEQVFTGYLRKIHAGTPIVLECEDEMYQLKKTKVEKQVLEKTTLKGLLTDICPAIKDKKFELKAVDVDFGQVRIEDDTTVSHVLDKYRHDARYNFYSYFKKGILYSGLAYWGDGRQEKTFEFGRNVISDELVFSDEEDVAVFVKLVHIFKDNARLKVEVGDETGNVQTFHYTDLTDKKYKDCTQAELDKIKEQLKEIGQEKIKKASYSGYRGWFKTFGEPVVYKGDLAKIIDTERPEREGSYLIKSVRRTYSYTEGLKQVVELDAKV